MTRTKSLLCHLVEAQVSRYLSGASLSDEALAQLDDHLDTCDGCREFLDRKKQELVATLGNGKQQSDPRQAVLQAIVDAHAVATPKIESESLEADDVPAAIRPQRLSATKEVKKAEPTSRVALLKPALYSLALALTLIVMSAFARDPSVLFGRRAGDLIPAAPAATTAAVTLDASSVYEETLATESETTEGAVDDESTSDNPNEKITGETVVLDETTTETAEPVIAEDSPPAPTASLPSAPARPASRAPVNRTPARAPSSGIRVYDAQGRPIQIPN